MKRAASRSGTAKKVFCIEASNKLMLPVAVFYFTSCAQHPSTSTGISIVKLRITWSRPDYKFPWKETISPGSCLIRSWYFSETMSTRLLGKAVFVYKEESPLLQLAYFSIFTLTFALLCVLDPSGTYFLSTCTLLTHESCHMSSSPNRFGNCMVRAGLSHGYFW